MGKRKSWKCGKCGFIRRTVFIPKTPCKECNNIDWHRTGQSVKATARMVENLFILKSNIVPEIVAEIQRLPEEIKTLNEKVFEAGRKLRDKRKTKDYIENQIILSVLKNKEKFSNEMMRRAEIERRKNFDNRYKTASENELIIEEEIEKLKGEVEYLKNRFSSLRYVIKFLAEVD